MRVMNKVKVIETILSYLFSLFSIEEVYKPKLVETIEQLIHELPEELQELWLRELVIKEY